MYYKIGDFAELAGVSRKTLRYYDDIGLLRPASVNARTGYRGYQPRQLSEIAAIAALKQLGLTLPQIRNAVQQGTGNERRRLLKQLKSTVESSISDAARLLTQIDAALSESDRTSHPVPVVIRRYPALRVASLRAEVNTYAGIQRLEQELMGAIPERSTAGLRGVLWHSCADSGTLEAEPFVQLCRPLSRRSYYDVRELPAVSAACAYSADDEAEAELAYAAIKRWMAAGGYTLAGAKREIYRGDIVEIQFPLSS